MAGKTFFRVAARRKRKNETFHVSRSPSGGDVVTVRPDTYRRALAAAAAASAETGKGAAEEVES